MDVSETRDVALLRGLLESDRVAGAYLLGDLEPPFFEHGRWFAATGSGGPAVVLNFSGLADPVLVSFGHDAGVDAILAHCARTNDLPSACYLKIPPEHEQAFARAFDVLERDTLKVMWLRAYREARRDGNRDIRRLDASFSIDAILDVYRSYPGHFFEPAQLTLGIYYGSFEDNRLVSVAGTHVFSPAARLGIVGNIVTRTAARGRGHAAACTRAVIDELRKRGCDTIVLHVAADNAPALACYTNLGFDEYGPVLQLSGRRRFGEAR